MGGGRVANGPRMGWSKYVEGPREDIIRYDRDGLHREKPRERRASGVFEKAIGNGKPALLEHQADGEKERQRVTLLAKSIRDLNWPTWLTNYLEERSYPKYREERPYPRVAYIYELVQMTEKEVSPYAQPRRALVHGVQTRLGELEIEPGKKPAQKEKLKLGMKLDGNTIAAVKGWIAGEAKKRIMGDDRPDCIPPLQERE